MRKLQRDYRARGITLAYTLAHGGRGDCGSGMARQGRDKHTVPSSRAPRAPRANTTHRTWATCLHSRHQTGEQAGAPHHWSWARRRWAGRLTGTPGPWWWPGPR